MVANIIIENGQTQIACCDVDDKGECTEPIRADTYSMTSHRLQ